MKQALRVLLRLLDSKHGIWIFLLLYILIIALIEFLFDFTTMDARAVLAIAALALWVLLYLRIKFLNKRVSK